MPVRTENDGDLVIKVGDGLVPSQQLTVNPDGSVNITDNSGSLTVDASDLDIRDLAFATDKVDASGSEVSLDAATLAALENVIVSATDLDIRDLAFASDSVDVSGSDITATVTATDLDIRDLAFATDKVDASGSEVSLDAATLAALENVIVSATDLDIRDLAFASDSVDVSGSDITATVSATDLDIRDLAFATDKVDASGSEVSLDAATLAALENVIVSATDLDIRDMAFATDSMDVSGSEISLDAATLAALENVIVSATDLDIRDLAFASDSVDVSGSDITATVTATDFDIRDLSHSQDSIKIGDGSDFLAINADGSINVVPLEDAGTETVNFNAASSIAAGASSNHDLVFASASKFYQVHASASGKCKIEVQIETAAASGIFNTIMVGFNSTANPNFNMQLAKYALIPAGAKVRVIRTNKDLAAQDMYSTIVGILG